jgi:inorganic pyrophosphatase/exopolyphosphatase
VDPYSVKNKGPCQEQMRDDFAARAYERSGILSDTSNLKKNTSFKKQQEQSSRILAWIRLNKFQMVLYQDGELLS